MQEQFITVNGNKIRYLDSLSENTTSTTCSDQILVLVHGLGASAERWMYAVPLLEKHFRLVIPDLIGFGYSDKPNVDYTMDFFTDFLRDFLKEINIIRSTIIGSSLGGQISAEFTSKNISAVEKLILVSPSGVMKTSTPALDSYIMAALYPNSDSARHAFESMSVSTEPIPDHIVDGFVTRMRLPNAKMAFMSTLLGLKNSDNLDKKLANISIPALLIWGKEDPVIPIRYARDFLSMIPHCQYLTMDGSGHTPYVDNPETFVEYALSFLK
jgi:pimeloyl-ACP methyl ester carboxylesterase